MELADRLIEALAFEAATAELRPRSVGEDRPDAPGLDPEAACLRAVPTALALTRRDDGTGDLWSHRLPVPSVGFAFGLTAHDLLLQLIGDARSPSAGRDAADLPTVLSRGILGSVSLPGSGLEVAAGAALAFALRNEPRVVVHFDDVASTASGDWHEGFNFAAVSTAPLVLVLRADEPGASKHTAVRTVLRKAAAYGVRASSVPSSDPAAVRDAVAAAITVARGGGGTQMVELAPGNAGRPLHERIGVPDAEFQERVSRRTADFRTLRDDLLSDRRDDPAAARGPGTSGSTVPIPWYRTPQLRSS